MPATIKIFVGEGQGIVKFIRFVLIKNFVVIFFNIGRGILYLKRKNKITAFGLVLVGISIQFKTALLKSALSA